MKTPPPSVDSDSPGPHCATNAGTRRSGRRHACTSSSPGTDIRNSGPLIQPNDEDELSSLCSCSDCCRTSISDSVFDIGEGCNDGQFNDNTISEGANKMVGNYGCMGDNTEKYIKSLDYLNCSSPRFNYPTVDSISSKYNTRSKNYLNTTPTLPTIPVFNFPEVTSVTNVSPDVSRLAGRRGKFVEPLKTLTTSCENISRNQLLQANSVSRKHEDPNSSVPSSTIHVSPNIQVVDVEINVMHRPQAKSQPINNTPIEERTTQFNHPLPLNFEDSSNEEDERNLDRIANTVLEAIEVGSAGMNRGYGEGNLSSTHEDIILSCDGDTGVVIGKDEIEAEIVRLAAEKKRKTLSISPSNIENEMDIESIQDHTLLSQNIKYPVNHKSITSICAIKPIRIPELAQNFSMSKNLLDSNKLINKNGTDDNITSQMELSSTRVSDELYSAPPTPPSPLDSPPPTPPHPLDERIVAEIFSSKRNRHRRRRKQAIAGSSQDTTPYSSSRDLGPSSLLLPRSSSTSSFPSTKKRSRALQSSFHSSSSFPSSSTLPKSSRLSSSPFKNRKLKYLHSNSTPSSTTQLSSCPENESTSATISRRYEDEGCSESSWGDDDMSRSKNEIDCERFNRSDLRLDNTSTYSRDSVFEKQSTPPITTKTNSSTIPAAMNTYPLTQPATIKECIVHRSSSIETNV